MGAKKEKTVAYILLCIMIISLLPVMYLGRYNHPTGDDYYYGIETKQVWEETGSLIKTAGEAIKGVARQYQIWQGTYSAMFFMHLPPNIFGDWAYHLVTTAILTLLTGGIFYLLRQLMVHAMKLSRELWILTSSVISLMCVQTVPVQGETFFWYNGSMYYTGYYAVTLFLFGLLIRYLLEPKKYHIPIFAILALFLAGGNYVSLLPAILTAGCMTMFLIWKRSPKAWGPGIVTVLMILGLLISAAAPGNAVRQEGMWKISPILAVYKSLRQGLGYMHAWMRIWWIMGAVLLTPFFWKAFERVKFRFPYPLIACGLAYGIFCSMSCPTFYTMNSTGPARAFTMVYYGFMLFTYGCYIYLLGYLHRLFGEKDFGGKLKGKIRILQWGIPAAWMILLVIQILGGSVAQTTTGKAVNLLVSGEARAYEAEYQERMRILNDPEITDVVLKPYEHQPDMLYVGDISGDPEFVTNQNLAAYFGKNSVCVK